MSSRFKMKTSRMQDESDGALPARRILTVISIADDLARVQASVDAVVEETKPTAFCKCCNKLLESKTALFLHSQSHRMTCDTCDALFNNTSDYFDHFDLLHRNSENPREVESHEELWKIIDSESAFSLFTKEDYPSRNLTWVAVGSSNPTCKQCKAQFSSRRALNLHSHTHEQELPITCQVCQQTYTSISDFIETCSIHCGASYLFDDPAERSRNGSRSPVFRCKRCPKVFCNQGNLNRHKLTHASVKNYLCDICHEAFTERIALQKHYLIHAEIKPYVCEMCERTFSSKANLKAHRETHNDEKMRVYDCFICGYFVTGLRNFKRHSMEHLPGQASSCPICGKTFATKKKLQLHAMIHSDERPFKCNICDRGFTYGSHLKRHQLSHTGERPYACGMCGETFIAKYSLTYHLNKHRRGHKS